MGPKFDQPNNTSPESRPLSLQQIKEAAMAIGEVVVANTIDLRENGVLRIELLNFKDGPLATFANGIKGYPGGVDSLISLLEEGGLIAAAVYKENSTTEIEGFNVTPIFEEKV